MVVELDRPSPSVTAEADEDETDERDDQPLLPVVSVRACCDSRPLPTSSQAEARSAPSLAPASSSVSSSSELSSYDRRDETSEKSRSASFGSNSGLDDGAADALLVSDIGDEAASSGPMRTAEHSSDGGGAGGVVRPPMTARARVPGRGQQKGASQRVQGCRHSLDI